MFCDAQLTILVRASDPPRTHGGGGGVSGSHSMEMEDSGMGTEGGGAGGQNVFQLTEQTKAVLSVSIQCCHY